MRARTFEIVQYEKNPKTGEDLGFNEDVIISGLNHKSIKEYAYVCHDKDVWTDEDEEKDPEYKTSGEPRPKHWHVVLRTGTSVELSVIAKWFKVEPQYIDIPKGRGAFLDKVEYLTHEHPRQQAAGKYRYPDEEIKSNFKWREALDSRKDDESKYGRDLSPEDRMWAAVRYEGMTLRQAQQKSAYIYMRTEERLHKARMYYISDQEPPRTRVNYYVYGGGGVGKGLACRAIARALFPDIKDDYDIFFEVGAKGAAFEGYDGQPVIIWNDRRAIDLLQELNGRGNVFNIFDTHPTAQRQNIKYGSVSLSNLVNIVNSVQPYEEFLDGLAGEYKTRTGEEVTAEDKAQSYRRFWFIIPINVDDFDIMVNKGVFAGTDKAIEYEQFQHIKYSFMHTRQELGGDDVLVKVIESKTLEPLVDKHNEIVKRESKDPEYARKREVLNKLGYDYVIDSDGNPIVFDKRDDGQLPGQMSINDIIDAGGNDA